MSVSNRNSYIKGAVLLCTTGTIQMEIFGDHGQSFCPIFTKTTTWEPFTLFLAFMLMLAKNPFNIIRKPINVLDVPNLIKIGQKL